MDHRQRPGDARVELDRGDDVRIRVYVSPLWTVLSSVFEVLLGWRRGVPDDWIRFVKDRIEGVDLSPLLAFDGEDRTVPNFLLPVPPRPAPTLDEELDALRRTPAKVVRRDLRAEYGRHVPARYKPYQLEPDIAFTTLTAAIEGYWDAVFKPSWPRMRAVLEREVVVCGRVLATEGSVAALARVNPEFKVRDGAVCFDSGRPGHVVTQVGDRTVALIPIVAGPDASLTSLDRADAVVLAYGVPGAAGVWHTGEGSATDSALMKVLGETRARIIAALTEPTSTTLLAKQLGLAPATVSHHLSALGEQGIVESTRVGNVVYYDLTERGDSLLSLFSA